MKTESLLELDLQLFEDGEGGDAGGAAAAAVQATPEADPTKGLDRKELARVQYGKSAGQQEPAQQPQTQVQTTTDTLEARRAEFEKLIKGDFKDVFGERTQQLLDARFKDYKASTEQLGRMQPILDALGSKYGVKPDDLDALSKAIAQDDSYFEDEAARKGLTVEQLKAFKQMEAENERLHQAVEERKRQEDASRIYARWQGESEQCKQIYPQFDLQAECQSEQTGRRFVDLLKNNVDVKTAYEIIHKDELLSGAIGYAVQTTQRRTMDNIRARGMRPAENGSSGSAAAQIAKMDVTKFTRKDREELARRAMRGERVEL